MVTVQIKDVYAQVLEPLDQSVEEAVQRLAIERATQQIAHLRQKASLWEEKYQCSYDLFAYRTATDETFLDELNADPSRQEWEADLFSWEFYAAELEEWEKRLLNILMM